MFSERQEIVSIFRNFYKFLMYTCFLLRKFSCFHMFCERFFLDFPIINMDKTWMKPERCINETRTRSENVHMTRVRVCIFVHQQECFPATFSTSEGVECVHGSELIKQRLVDSCKDIMGIMLPINEPVMQRL